MITAWMLYSLLIGAVVSIGALVVDRAARAANVPRRWTWAGALALLLTLTALAPWRGEDSAVIAVGTQTSSVAPPTAVFAPQPSSFADRLLRTLASPTRDGIDALVLSVPVRVDRAVGVLWLLASAGTLLSVLAMLRKLDRSRRVWPRAVMHGHDVRVTTEHGPAVYGVLRPDIVLPSALLGCSADDQRLVLAHENEHRRARDPLLLSATALGVALVPWHPLAWWLASRLRLAIELDCDARVLRQGISPRRYGALLLELSSHLLPRRGALHALALFDSRTHLERRLLAMTTRPSRRTPLAISAFLLATSAIVFAACNTDVPTAAQIRDADATTVTKTLGLPAGDDVSYFVDGKPVSAAVAERITAGEIETINVSGKVADEGLLSATARGAEVRIVTRRLANADGAISTQGDSSRISRVTSMLSDSQVVVLRGRKDSASIVVGSLMRDRDSSEVLFRVNADTMEVALMRDSNSTTVLQRPIGQPRVILRGSSSTTAGDPLVVIDGVISTLGNDALRNIDPSSIESIEVVKGSAAVSLYGQRAANGVIAIKSKKVKQPL